MLTSCGRGDGIDRDNPGGVVITGSPIVQSQSDLSDRDVSLWSSSDVTDLLTQLNGQGSLQECSVYQDRMRYLPEGKRVMSQIHIDTPDVILQFGSSPQCIYISHPVEIKFARGAPLDNKLQAVGPSSHGGSLHVTAMEDNTGTGERYVFFN